MMRRKAKSVTCCKAYQGIHIVLHMQIATKHYRAANGGKKKWK